MTGPTDRPDDQPRDGSTPGGFSWDDPAPAAASPGPRTGSGDTPAAYPPPAPYPPAGAGSDDAAAAAFGEQPTGRPQDADQPDHGRSGYGTADQDGYGAGYGSGYGTDRDAYGTPAAGGTGYGSAAAGGYGSSAQYTSTPQPYAYGTALSPEGERARSSAVLWTVLNAVAIFLCGNVLSIVGVVLAAISIGRAREDVASAERLTRWSWILFAAGFALAVLLVVGVLALGLLGALGTAGAGLGF